jgi:hypothetical protein
MTRGERKNGDDSVKNDVDAYINQRLRLVFSEFLDTPDLNSAIEASHDLVMMLWLKKLRKG